MERMPTADNPVSLESIGAATPEAVRQQEFERLETQQYQLVIPAKYEQLRGYLANDGLLSDEEITRCLYEETLRKSDLAKRIEERTPTANEADRKGLTDYLWEVHQTVKGLPLTFIDPSKTYRVDVVDTPSQPVQSKLSDGPTGDVGQTSLRNEVSPVTLHLDINGGFLANFLHNAQLNHKQMNRFIADLERQHQELRAQIGMNDLHQSIQKPDVNAERQQEQPYQLLQESVPLPTTWQRIRQSVSDWIAPSASERATDNPPHDIARQSEKPPELPQFIPHEKGGSNPRTAQAEAVWPKGESVVNEPAVYYASRLAADSVEPGRVNQLSTPTAGVAIPPTNQAIETNQKQTITMNETSAPGVELPVTNRPTRYQWAEVAAQFDRVGVTRQELEKAGHLDDLLNGRKTGLMKLTQIGEEGRPFQVSGKLYIVNTPDQGPIIGIQPERKQLLLPKEFLGYELTARDKQNLEKNGEMGKRVKLTDKVSGRTFTGYVGVDKETKSLTVLRAERLRIPQTIKGVTLTKPQQKNLEQGRAIKLEGMTSNNGQTFNAYVQVSAAKRSLTFAKIPENAIKQTVDQKTAQDLTKPVHQLKGDGAGGKKTIQPKEEAKQTAAQRVESPKPAKQQKPTAPKPVVEETKPKREKKPKAPRVG